MRQLLLLFFMLMAWHADAQSQGDRADSLHLLTSCDWSLREGKPGDRKLVFIPERKDPVPDTTGKSPEIKDSLMRTSWQTRRMAGIYLFFDANGNVRCADYRHCAYGGTRYRVEQFAFDRLMDLHIHVKPYDAPETQHECRYEMIALSEDEMVWRRVR